MAHHHSNKVHCKSSLEEAGEEKTVNEMPPIHKRGAGKRCSSFKTVVGNYFTGSSFISISSKIPRTHSSTHVGLHQYINVYFVEKCELHCYCFSYEMPNYDFLRMRSFILIYENVFGHNGLSEMTTFWWKQ